MMKEIKGYFIVFVGGLIPELTLAYIVIRLTNEGWWVFWLTYIAIQVFYLIVWFFRSIVNSLLFRVYFKRQMIKDIFEGLVKWRYPIEDYVIYDKAVVERYFEDIVYEPQIQAETRINAGAVCTRLNVLRELGNYQGFLRVRKAAFEAVKNYFMKKDERIDPQRVVNFSTIKSTEELSSAMRSLKTADTTK